MTRQKHSRREVIKGAAALGFTLFASSVRAQAPEPVAITPQLIDAAKREGKVILYSAMDLPVGEKLGNAFQAQYPGIEVQIERSGSERLFQRIAQEFSSNIHAADVITTADASHVISWKRNGWLAPFVPEDVAKYFPNQYRDADGMFATSRLWLSSIAYNTNLVKAADAPDELRRPARSPVGGQDGEGTSRLQRHHHDRDLSARA
jgi:iron(III) transport system substrate-binding protein